MLGMLAAAGPAAVVATPAEVFTAVKVAGAIVLIVLGPWGRRVERLTGAVLVALGARLAFERR